MSYFGQAVMVISEIGGHGDYELSGDEFSRDDRSKRVHSAADSLCDFVYEYLNERFGEDYGDMGIFKQEHLPTIERMIAIGMMAQFEHDQEREAALVEGAIKAVRDIGEVVI
jgi:hypothetical protein